MRDDILVAVRGLAEVYDKNLNNELNQIWVQALSDLSPEELLQAVKAYVLDPKNLFFPRPGQIYGLARPEGDKEEEASLIADNIFAALRCFGTDQLGTDRAQMKIGEIGWTYILRQGGWDSFVRSIKNEDDVPILKSQARKSIMGLIQRKRSGMPLLNALSLKDLGVDIKHLK